MRMIAVLSATTAALLVVPACVRQFSTDIPVNFQSELTSKYRGRTAWTRASLQDEKKEIKIEQDEEVEIAELGMHRTGSVTLVAKKGRKRIVFPFHLERPLTLEQYEKALLDYVWLESPEARFSANKEKYGTRIAEAVRDHKILKDMPQYAAYLAWGVPTRVEEIGAAERWVYETPNVKGGLVDFLNAKVAKFQGENIQDTEEAKKKKAVRRGTTTAAAER